MTEPSLRAADADRERTAERLRSATAEGRLSAEELEERLEAALGASMHGQLEVLVADLPAEPPAGLGSGRGHGRARGWGDSERAAFLATSAVLVAIWALTGLGYFWPIWPILGWGVFVLGPAVGLPLPACGSRRRGTVRGHP
jgi:Domain of unknown function (DUF1707)